MRLHFRRGSKPVKTEPDRSPSGSPNVMSVFQRCIAGLGWWQGKLGKQAHSIVQSAIPQFTACRSPSGLRLSIYPKRSSKSVDALHNLAALITIRPVPLRDVRFADANSMNRAVIQTAQSKSK